MNNFIVTEASVHVAILQWEFVYAEPESMIWVDLRRFDLLWQGSDDYIGAKGARSSYDKDRYAKVGDFICRHRRLYYPVVALVDGSPMFTDGRHRTAWLRDHNALAVPLICSDEDAAILADRCGSDRRETFFREPAPGSIRQPACRPHIFTY